MHIHHQKHIALLAKVSIAAFLLWSFFMIGMAAYGLRIHRLHINGIARFMAANAFNKDLLYRRWVARYGGVYIPVSAGTPPNPYLSNIENRDIITRSGMELTLVNPAYMTRMVQEMSRKLYGYEGHITSLNPLRPGNQPDAWEKKSLLAFKAGKTEIFETVLIAGKPYLRYMKKCVTEKSCLKCHARQGYHLGDLRGGISVSIPLLPLKVALAPQIRNLMVTYLILYLLGGVGIGAGFFIFRRTLLKTQKQDMWLQKLFEIAPIGIGEVNKDRILTTVNRKFCEITGYSEAELVGQNTSMLYPHKKEYEKLDKVYMAARQGSRKIENLELQAKHKNGTLIYGLFNAIPWDPDDPSAGIVFTLLDITARKQYEKKLIASENKFRNMMESIHDPVYICSSDRLIEYMNPAMVMRTGRDAVGEHCYTALHNFSEPCPWCEGKEQKEGEYFETEISSPKDNRAYILSHAPFYQDDGRISTLTIFKDITDLNNTRMQLYQAQKMESIGTLAGGVAHDFNNILTVIRGHAEMGLMTAAEDSREHKDFLAIEKASEKAKQLTYQLLAFSRKQRISPTKLIVNNVIQELSKMLRRLIGEDITINTSLSGKLVPIQADQGQIEQIIINLMVNAADAISDCSATKPKIITISTSNITLDYDFTSTHPGSKVGMYLLLEIADTGKGMDKKTMEHIFEPFYTTKAQGKGTGLGLATVYGIVKQNNGYIDVDSVPGKGTTFKIYWPRIEAFQEETAPQEEDRRPQPAGGSEVILLVEDDSIIRNITCKHLQQAGYTVIEADNGADALEKAEKAPTSIDLLFTDMVMPVMSGRELAKRIADIYPTIEILYTSGYFDDRAWGNDSPIPEEKFIDKPYDQNELLKRIRQLLDSRKI